MWLYFTLWSPLALTGRKCCISVEDTNKSSLQAISTAACKAGEKDVEFEFPESHPSNEEEPHPFLLMHFKGLDCFENIWKINQPLFQDSGMLAECIQSHALLLSLGLSKLKALELDSSFPALLLLEIKTSSLVTVAFSKIRHYILT